MTVHALGILLLKIWGVLMLAWGTTSILQGATNAVIGAQPYMSFLTSGVNAIMTLTFGTILLLLPERIMTWIYPYDPDAERLSSERSSIADLQEVVFAGIGAYLFIRALRDIGTIVYTLARKPSWDETGTMEYLFQNQQTELGGAVVQLVAAAVLLTRRRRLAAQQPDNPAT